MSLPKQVWSIYDTEKQTALDLCAEFKGFAVTKPEGSPATQQELMSGLLKFVAAHRMQTQAVPIYEEDGETEVLDEFGDPVIEYREYDAFACLMDDILAEREAGGGAKRNSKLKSVQSELEKAREELAKLKAAMSGQAAAVDTEAEAPVPVD